MNYSFTEKKRLRKDFGKRSGILATLKIADMPVPNLLTIQLESYRTFLQKDTPPEERLEVGLHAAFKSVFPIDRKSVV